jgi:hypothetical protein
MKFNEYLSSASRPDTTERQTDTTMLVIERPYERAWGRYWLYPATALFSHISISFEIVCPNKSSNSDRLFEINFHSFTSSAISFLSSDYTITYVQLFFNYQNRKWYVGQIYTKMFELQETYLKI